VRLSVSGRGYRLPLLFEKPFNFVVDVISNNAGRYAHKERKNIIQCAHPLSSAFSGFEEQRQTYIAQKLFDTSIDTAAEILYTALKVVIL